MRFKVSVITLCLLVPLAAGAQHRNTYSWVDDDGITHFGDRIPPEFADKPKSVLNEHGVTVEHLRGKKTQAEKDAEVVAAKIKMQEALQLRADRALLSTYVNVDEITMHRDRRVELFQAQARVTELYLRNSKRRLGTLEERSKRFKPYSSDPSAPKVPAELIEDANLTKETIARLQSNLTTYRTEEQQIIARFEGDIARFTCSPVAVVKFLDDAEFNLLHRHEYHLRDPLSWLHFVAL